MSFIWAYQWVGTQLTAVLPCKARAARPEAQYSCVAHVNCPARTQLPRSPRLAAACAAECFLIASVRTHACERVYE